jgi:hypothetical protein
MKGIGLLRESWRKLTPRTPEKPQQRLTIKSQLDCDIARARLHPNTATCADEAPKQYLLHCVETISSVCAGKWYVTSASLCISGATSRQQRRPNPHGLALIVEVSVPHVRDATNTSAIICADV